MLAHGFGAVVLWRLLVFDLQSRWRLAVGAHGGTVLFIILHGWEQRKDGAWVPIPPQRHASSNLTFFHETSPLKG